jgi:DNA-binding PadR family transcriptional regulator
MANDEIRLNQQALFDVLDDLRRAGFIDSFVIHEGGFRIEETKITLTKRGQELIAIYADAFGGLGDYDQRNIKMFDRLLRKLAAKSLDRFTWMPPDRVTTITDGGEIFGGEAD